jgi:ElaB/YqjD/DUF883 family membrane-anchored ribosome-binding protein
MTFEDAANSTMRDTLDQGRETAAKATQTLKDGYGAAREYVHEKSLDFDLREFARREPWLAIAGAFAIGYFTAHLIRRVS